MANKPNLIKTAGKTAFETTLVTTIDSDDTTIVLTNADGLPTANFALCLDYDVVASREVVGIESRSGTTLTVYTDGRGLVGTSAVSHTGGVCKVRAIAYSGAIDEMIDQFLVEHSDTGVHSSTNVVTLSAGDITSVITGWVIDSDTWVYVSATSFKIEGKDVTATFTKGTKIRYKQGGAYEYGTVASSAFSTDTTVTLIANIDYALADAVITDAGYSYVENPQGYPHTFNFTPTLTLSGGSGNTVPQYSSTFAKFSINGNICKVSVHVSGDGGNEGAGTGLLNLALPIAAVSGMSTSQRIGSAYVYASGGTIIDGGAHWNTGNLAYIKNASGTNITGADQSSTDRRLTFDLMYMI